MFDLFYRRDGLPALHNIRIFVSSLLCGVVHSDRDVFFTERNDLHDRGDLVGRPEGLFTELCQVNDQWAPPWEPEGACAATYRLPTTVKATTSQASTELLER